jgi:hypothetical protein
MSNGSVPGSIVPFFNPSTHTVEQIIEKEFLLHLCYGQYSASLSFLESAKPAQIQPKLVTLLLISHPPLYSQLNPRKSPSFYRIALDRVARSYFPSLPPLDDTAILLFILSDIGKSWSGKMGKWLSELAVPDRLMKQFLQNLFTFSRECPALFRALTARASVILSRFGLTSVLPVLGLQSLEVIPAATPEFVGAFPFDSVTPANVADFWQTPTVLCDPRIATQFQAIFAVREPYPQPARLFGDSNLLSLVHEVACKRRTFPDLIRRLAHAAFMMKDFVSLQAILETFPELRPWLFLSDHKTLAGDQLLFYSTLELFDSEDWPFNLNTRFKNDRHLLNFLKQMLGIVVLDFASLSLAMLLAPVLSKVEFGILNFLRSAEFFAISDRDRDLDFSFMFAFRALAIALESFSTREFDDETFGFCIDYAGGSDGLIVDLFSLIFLQKDGVYVCPLPAASWLLAALVPRAESHPQVLQAFLKVQCLSALDAMSVADCFGLNIGSFLSALDRKDFRLAALSASGNLALTRLCDTARAVWLALGGRSLPKHLQTDAFLAEWPLVTQSGAYKGRSHDPAVNQLILQRSGLTEGQVLRIVDPDGDLAEAAAAGIAGGAPVRYFALRAFAERVELCDQIAAISDAGFMNALAQSDKIESWDAVERVLGQRALESILVSCDLSKATDKFLRAIGEASPIVEKTIRVTNERKVQKRALTFGRLAEFAKRDGDVADVRAEEYAILAEELSDVGGREQAVFDRIFAWFTKEAITEGVLFALLDAADQLFRCEIPENIRNRFFDTMLLIEPFPIEFAAELRLRGGVVDFERIPMNVRLAVFPERATGMADVLLALGIPEADPAIILEKLVERGDLGDAARFASLHKLADKLPGAIVNRAIEILAEGGDLEEFFSGENSLAYGIFELLPIELKTIETMAKFKKIVGWTNNSLTPEVDFDRTIIARLDSSSISSIESFLCDFYPRLRDPSQAQASIIDGLTAIIQTFSVADAESERAVFKQLRKAQRIWRIVSGTSPVVDWLLEFVSHFFNLRFHACYSFFGCFSTPDDLLPFCLIYDEFDLILSASLLWPGIRLSPLLLSECQFCFSLGDPSGAVPFLDLQAPGDSYPGSLWTVLPLLQYPLPFVMQPTVDSLRVEVVPVYSRLCAILTGRQAGEIPRSNVEFADRTILAFRGELASLESKIGRRDFAPLLTVPLSVPVWRDSVFRSVFETNCWPAFWRFVARTPEALAVVSNSLDDITAFLRGCRCLQVLQEIQLRLNLREDAILTLVDLTDFHSSWFERADAMLNAETLIGAEIAERRIGKRAQKVSDRALVKLLEAAVMMKEIAQRCTAWGVAFDAGHNLFRGDAPIDAIVFICLFHRDFSLGLRIANGKPDLLGMVVHKLVMTLKCGVAGAEAIVQYQAEINARLGGAEYELLTTTLVFAASTVVKRVADLEGFILKYVKGADLQVKVLVKLGILRTALKVCPGKASMALIYQAAIDLNDEKLIKECRRALAKRWPK